MHGWIMRQWTPRHKHVRAPSPLPHNSKSLRLKETQNDSKRCIHISLWSFLLVIWFVLPFIVMLCLFVVILHLFMVILIVLLVDLYLFVVTLRLFGVILCLFVLVLSLFEVTLLFYSHFFICSCLHLFFFHLVSLCSCFTCLCSCFSHYVLFNFLLFCVVTCPVFVVTLNLFGFVLSLM